LLDASLPKVDLEYPTVPIERPGDRHRAPVQIAGYCIVRRAAGGQTLVRRPVPVLLVALLLVLGAWSAIFLEWRQPAYPADLQVQWSVGPFGAGDAFEQRFQAEISHLSRVEVSLRGPPGGGAGQTAVLHFRLRGAGVAVREGVVEVAGLVNSRRVVAWSFPPIGDSAGREYNLQVVVAEVSGEGLLADTTTEDLLPGSIVSNGTASGEHIDLVLHAYRQVGRRTIAEILGRTVPGGVVTLVLAVFTSGAVGAIGLLRHRGEGALKWEQVLTAVPLGVVLVAVLELIPLAQYGNIAGAETDPGLVFATRALMLAFAATPWVLLAGARALGRCDGLAGSGATERLLAMAVVTTVTAAALLPFTQEPEYFQIIDVMEEGRPWQGRIPWLGQNVAGGFGRVAVVLWLVVAVRGWMDRRTATRNLRRRR